MTAAWSLLPDAPDAPDASVASVASVAPGANGTAVPERSLVTGQVSLAVALRSYRAAHALSVRAAGELVGGSHWVWAQWERGTVPGPAYLRRLADLLGLSPGEVRRLAGPDRVRRAESTGDGASHPLARARVEAGLTAAELARRVHVSPALVSRWESGTRIPARTYWGAVADALGVDRAVVASWHADRPAASDHAVVCALRATRVARRMTQTELASALGIDVSTVQRWERTGKAPVRRARDLARLLAVDPAGLARPVVAEPRRTTPPGPLRVLRRRRGASAAAVAERVGVSRSALLSWESGASRPSWAHARRLAQVLDVPVDRVFAAARLDPPVALDPRRWTSGSLPVELPRIVRELRRWHGLTQHEFAALVGVSPATVGGWEAGTQRPRRSALERLDDRFGLPRRLSALVPCGALQAVGSTAVGSTSTTVNPEASARRAASR